LVVVAALYGLGSLDYSLLGTTVGNSYYAELAEEVRAEETVDFSTLTAKNPEIKAWVVLDDTAIDLPIVQTSDNAYYLTHRFDEKKNKLGTPFIDAGNLGDFSDRHTVVYGHAVKSGAMFGSFWEYENPNYYRRHPELKLYLPDGTQYTLAVFSCARVEGVRSAIPLSFSSENAFLAYLDELHELSAFDSTVTFAEGDRIVSFCMSLPDGSEDGLLLVSCKLVGDDPIVQTADEETAEQTQTDILEQESPEE
jgi:sortase B